MRTIFIPIYHGLQSANVFQTETIHAIMREPDVRVVVFCRPTKYEYYQQLLQGYGDRLIIEPMEAVSDRTLTEKLLKFVAANLIDTWDVYYLRRKQLLKNGKLIQYLAARCVAKLFGRSRLLRMLFRTADLRLNSRNIHDEYFLRYAPELVFASDVLGLHPNETRLMREAKRRGVNIVAMVRSWDNLTSKGVVRVQPDILIAHTRRMADEAVRLADMRPEAIRTVGVPGFDYYVGYRPSTQEAFYARAGLPVGRRFLLFSPLFEMYTESTVAILKFLEESIEGGVLPNDLAILVRYPPSYTSRALPEFNGSRVVFFTQPGKRFPDTETRHDWEFDVEDKQHLADTIHYAAMTVNFVSTITIESAILGRPVVNICFETQPNAPVTKSLAMLYMQDHIRPLMRIGGFKLSRSKDDLIRDIQTYLANPNEDAGQRAELIKEYTGIMDGKAGERVAGVIIGALPKVR